MGPVFWNLYGCIVCRREPHRIQDLLGYQTLIIEASLEYQSDGWIGYDRRLQQRTATNPNLVWANIDSTLWNLAFAGKASASRCRHCFSLSHSSVQCDWTPNPPPLMDLTTPFPRSQRQIPICRAGSTNPRPSCPLIPDVTTGTYAGIAIVTVIKVSTAHDHTLPTLLRYPREPSGSHIQQPANVSSSNGKPI